MTPSVAALLLVIPLAGLFAFVMAKAGIYAALRHAIHRHTPGEVACLKCLREREL